MPDAPVMVRHTHLETFIVATLMAMKMPRTPAEITAGLRLRVSSGSVKMGFHWRRCWSTSAISSPASWASLRSSADQTRETASPR